MTDQKHDKYPELIHSDRVHYVVLACEEGGRWGPNVFKVVEDLVRLKVAPLHPLLRRSAALAYTRKWWAIPWHCGLDVWKICEKINENEIIKKSSRQRKYSM